MMNFMKAKKYEGFSLVEMLITIVIIGVVMLISSTTLTTLVKISSVSSNKTRVRNETEFVLELIRRTVRNSDPSDVYVYNSFAARKYDPTTNLVVDSGQVPDISTVYGTSLVQNQEGNEIQFRPYGYENWICIGFFQSTLDSEMGYILKTSAQNLWNQHDTCFINNSSSDYTKYIIPLNSDIVDIDNFKIAYTVLEDSNYLIRFDIEAHPTQWYLAPGAPLNKEVYRQAVVSTEGIVW